MKTIDKNYILKRRARADLEEMSAESGIALPTKCVRRWFAWLPVEVAGETRQFERVTVLYKREYGFGRGAHILPWAPARFIDPLDPHDSIYREGRPLSVLFLQIKQMSCYTAVNRTAVNQFGQVYYLNGDDRIVKLGRL